MTSKGENPQITQIMNQIYSLKGLQEEEYDDLIRMSRDLLERKKLAIHLDLIKKRYPILGNSWILDDACSVSYFCNGDPPGNHLEIFIDRRGIIYGETQIRVRFDDDDEINDIGYITDGGHFSYSYLRHGNESYGEYGPRHPSENSIDQLDYNEDELFMFKRDIDEIRKIGNSLISKEELEITSK